MQIDLKMKKSGTLNITEDLHLSKGDREMTVSSSSKNIQSQGYHEDNSSSQIVRQTNDKYSADTPCLREVLSPSNSIRTEIGEFRPSFSSVSNVTSKNKPNKSMSDLEYESLSSRSLWYKACLASEAKELLRKQCEVEQTVSPSGSTLVTSGTLTDDEANDTASDSSTVGGVVGLQPLEDEESVLQSSQRSNLAQVEALQKEINEMREKSSNYHELLEDLDTIQAENERLESQIEDVSLNLEKEIKSTDKMKNLLQALTSHVEKQESNQNRQFELYDEKVKQLKSIIIRDQRYFAKTEMGHQVTFRNLIIEKEKAKKLEAILDQQDDNESLISYDFDTPMERKEISRLEQKTASLNMEIAHIRSRDDYHIMQIKQLEADLPALRETSSSHPFKLETVENENEMKADKIAALKQTLRSEFAARTEERDDNTREKKDSYFPSSGSMLDRGKIKKVVDRMKKLDPTNKFQKRLHTLHFFGSR